MIRGILILAIIGYLIYRFGKLLFKFFYLISGEQEDRARTTFEGKRRPVDGNVNIDKVPDKDRSKNRYQGGDYVDYEEI